jgi:hypothetical protein
MIRARIILTVMWIAAFIGSLILVESYVHTRDSAGMRYMLPEDRPDCIKPLFILYGVYLGGILSAWFVHPFPPAKSESAVRARFVLAVWCTAIFNGVILFLLVQSYFDVHTTVLANTRQAMDLAQWGSFLVAPVNLYFFGIKLPNSATNPEPD